MQELGETENCLHLKSVLLVPVQLRECCHEERQQPQDTQFVELRHSCCTPSAGRKETGISVSQRTRKHAKTQRWCLAPVSRMIQFTRKVFHSWTGHVCQLCNRDCCRTLIIFCIWNLDSDLICVVTSPRYQPTPCAWVYGSRRYAVGAQYINTHQVFKLEKLSKCFEKLILW